MEASKFDTLLRESARQATRRETLGVLLGGALLLGHADGSEANKQAERRRRRRRKQRRREARIRSLRPIKVLIKNPGSKTVSLTFGGLNDNIFHWVCEDKRTIQLNAGGEVQYDTTKPITDAYAWIDGKYAIEFWNPFLKTPAVSAAANGMSFKGTFCPPRGTRAVLPRPLSRGVTSEFRIYDKVFVVTRKQDTNYIEFTLTLPTNL